MAITKGNSYGSYILYESTGNKLALWEYFISYVLMFLIYIINC